MNSRRKFLTISSAALASTLIAPLAKANCSPNGHGQNCAAFKGWQVPSNVVYTAKDPGKWAKKVGSHSPKTKLEGTTLTVTTEHPMSPKHYIVRHTVVDYNGNVIAEKTFAPTDKKAVSTSEIDPKLKGTNVYVTSFCNLHDFWVAEYKL